MRETRTPDPGSEQKIRRGGWLVLQAAILSVLWSGDLQACLNDREVERGEAQFRSRYEAPLPVVVADHEEMSGAGWIATGTGVGLAVGSTVVAIGRKKRGQL